MKKYIVSIIGSGDELTKDSDYYKCAFNLGKLLIDENFRLLTGGLGGVMMAASEGARNSTNYKDGDVIGILPSLDYKDANPYIDIPIVTGLGINRNTIVAGSLCVIAIGGGSGAMSEIAFAWQLGRLILCREGDGCSGMLANKKLDNRRDDNKRIDKIIFGFKKESNAIKILKSNLYKYV